MLPSRYNRLFLFPFLFLLLLFTPSVPVADAKPTATFTVTNLNNSGTGSLRWAINQSNLAGGSNTINFTVSGTIKLLWSLPQIVMTDLTINAPAGGITINGNGTQVFFVRYGSTLTLNGITITNGYTRQDFGGGAIYNAGTLYLNNCTLFGNRASSQGGAIFNDYGTVNITNSTIRDNTADTSGSSPAYESFFAAGGGLYTLGGTANITSSTFSGNTAWVGGGMYIKGGFFDVVSSTFSGNNAVTSVGGNGGAIYIDGGFGWVYQSTIASNNATLTGGIVNNNGTVTLYSSIVANNIVGGNCSGTINDSGGNLQFNPNSGCVGVALDPKLGILADNGGPTKTMALGSGSAAINLVSSSNYCRAVDQRGFPRDTTDGYCDAGAYEYGAKGSTTTTLSSSPNPSVYGQSVTFTAVVTSTSGGAPTGNVSFVEGATTLGTGTVNSSNVATFSTSSLNVGTHIITANYVGDSNYTSSTSTALSHVVNKANTTTTITGHTPNPSDLNQAVQASFTVIAQSPGSGTPTGNVTVGDGAASCTGTTAAGQCQITLTVLGIRTLVATYAGDTNFNGSVSAGVAHLAGKGVFLPVIMRNFVTAPDLIVQSISATPLSIQIVIKNQGNAPVLSEFWVDGYINPSPAPTGVNQLWNQLGSQGMVWAVTATGVQALSPGGTLLLSNNDKYYRSDLSQVVFPLGVGGRFYAQVDSANILTNYGAVLETHEVVGAAYNNINSTTVSPTAAPIPKVLTPTLPNSNVPIQPLPPRK